MLGRLSLVAILVLGAAGCSSSKSSVTTTPPDTPLATVSTLAVGPLAAPGGGVFGELVAFHPTNGSGSALVLLPANTVKNYPLEFAKGWDVTVLSTGTTWHPSRCGVMPSISTSTNLIWFEKPLYNADLRAYQLNVFDGISMRSFTPTRNSREHVESLSLQAGSLGEKLSYVYRQVPPPDLTAPTTEPSSQVPGAEIVGLAEKLNAAATDVASSDPSATTTTSRLPREFGRLIIRTADLNTGSFVDHPIVLPTGVGAFVAHGLGGQRWLLETVSNAKPGRSVVTLANGKVTIRSVPLKSTIVPTSPTLGMSVWASNVGPATASVAIDGADAAEIPVPPTVQRCVLAIRP